MTYVPDWLPQPSVDNAVELARQSALASVVVTADDRPLAAHVPVEIDTDGQNQLTLRFHVAAKNPIASWLGEGQHALLIFRGPDGYISPRWYDHENVPTWDYAFVHMSGVARSLQRSELKRHVLQLVDRFDVGLDVNDGFVERFLGDIRGFEITSPDVQPVIKLSQDKNTASIEGVVDGLRQRSQPGDVELATAIERTRDAVAAQSSAEGSGHRRFVESEFADDRLVAVYDTLNAYQPGTQPDFYERVANDVGARSVIEIGCGTGLIAERFIQGGYDYTGVEPATKMLNRARLRDPNTRARWIDGGVEALGVIDADFVFMAGHVAQFFLTDDAWSQALRSIHASLRPGGHLSFETRNPEAREWERWTAATRTTTSSSFGPIETWTNVERYADGLLSYTLHYQFIELGEEVVAAGRLRFRTFSTVERSLADAGFEVEQAYGEWDRSPISADCKEFIVIARRM